MRWDGMDRMIDKGRRSGPGVVLTVVKIGEKTGEAGPGFCGDLVTVRWEGIMVGTWRNGWRVEEWMDEWIGDDEWMQMGYCLWKCRACVARHGRVCGIFIDMQCRQIYGHSISEHEEGVPCVRDACEVLCCCLFVAH